MTALMALRIPATAAAAASTQLLQFRDHHSTTTTSSSNGSFEALTNVEMFAAHRSRPSLSLFSNSHHHHHRFSSICWKRRHSWNIAFALNTGGTSDGGSQDNLNSDSGGLGQTRLGRIVGAGGKQLLEKLNAARKNFPMKIFLLLLGFYTANALATILGQTGDWDVLVAGVVVAAIEGIGMLMYKKPPPLLIGRFQSLVGMVNYWKAGVCLGLFVDAFKLGS